MVTRNTSLSRVFFRVVKVQLKKPVFIFVATMSLIGRSGEEKNYRALPFVQSVQRLVENCGLLLIDVL